MRVTKQYDENLKADALNLVEQGGRTNFAGGARPGRESLHAAGLVQEVARAEKAEEGTASGAQADGGGERGAEAQGTRAEKRAAEEGERDAADGSRDPKEKQRLLREGKRKKFRSSARRRPASELGVNRQHEPQGELLGQRRHRGLLRDDKNRARLRPHLADTARAPRRRLRIGILRPLAATLIRRLQDARIGRERLRPRLAGMGRCQRNRGKLRASAGERVSRGGEETARQWSVSARRRATTRPRV
jgi:hypothetical protein